ncbi:MAG TPA: M28 family peptidase [Candidatus Angelobacter sp.]|nr:M28 family peptidase [Candidatus Angelobacter sp.]
MSLLRSRSLFSMIFSIALLMSALPSAVAQKPGQKPPAQKPSQKKARPSAPAARAKRDRDPVIAQVIKDVSPEDVRRIDEKLVSFGNRSTLSVNNPDAATSGKGIVAARNWIKAEFERISADCHGCLEVKTDTFVEQPKNRIPVPTEIQNVYAILKGTDPAQAKRVYLVTGHYDSRNSSNENTTDPAPGANDDGSGTTVSLECARVLSKHRFPATIVFLTVAGEEQGLNGSTHFAKMAKAEGWQLEGVLNNDIVGGNTTPGDTLQNKNWVRVFSEGIPAAATDADMRRIKATGGENDSTSRQLARYIHQVSEIYDFGAFTPKLIFRRDRYLRGGDHSAFNDSGFAAVRFTEYREDFNHQHQNVRTENGIEYGDLPKFVDFDYLANVARLNAATLAALASSPAPPAEVRLLTRQLENDSKIEWKAAPGAAAYEVLWRKTTDPVFADDDAVRTTETKIDLPDSKDNAIFGVRSVDAKGHRSLIVIPEPER